MLSKKQSPSDEIGFLDELYLTRPGVGPAPGVRGNRFHPRDPPMKQKGVLLLPQ
jgi:hypothetical protein